MSEKKYALLIASFEYDDPYFRRLEAPAEDVEALSRVLRDPAMGAFSDVKVLLNEPKDKLVLGIEDFFDNRNTEDLLLLYFSGHGVKDEDGRLYYATKNTLHKRLVATAVPAYQVNDLIAKCRSRRKILMLDCCYSGAFSKALLSKGDQTVGVMEEFKQGQGLVTLTASDALQYSFEGEEAGADGAGSVFTQAVVEGITTGKADKDDDQLISLDELYDYAYERVHAENPQQTPRKSGEVEGRIYVALNPQPLRPAPLDPKLLDEIESPFPEVREGIVRTLDALLRGRNKGLALAAQAALLKLKEDDSRKVASAAETCLLAWEKSAEGERPARDKAEQGTPGGEKAEAAHLAAQRAEQERLARERADAERQAAATAAADRVALEKAEQERLEREKAEQERLRQEEVERDELTREKAEQERLDRISAFPVPAPPVYVRPLQRVGADLIDYLLIVLVMAIFETRFPVLGFTLSLPAVVLGFSYCICATGRTLGHLWMGTRIVDYRGNPLTYFRSLAYVLAWLAWFAVPSSIVVLGFYIAEGR